MVYELFLSAKKNIQTWINLDKPCRIIEGETIIDFVNPNCVTSAAPDINDSSIVMCVQHGDNKIYLTGDVCSGVLVDSLANNNFGYAANSLLKVSHHGSRTGTDEMLIKWFMPEKAIISAGYSKRYKHPHSECVEALHNSGVDITVTKEVKRTSEYQCDGRKITQRIL